MDGQRVRPYVAFGAVGAGAGFAAGSVAILLKLRLTGQPVQWTPEVAAMAWAGAFAGAVLGAGWALAVSLFYRTSPEVQRREQVEKRDVQAVIPLFHDIEAGSEMHAWQALAMLPSFADERITERMIFCLRRRLESREILTRDPAELVRQAFLCVLNVGNPPDVERLRELARHDTTIFGVTARRLTGVPEEWKPVGSEGDHPELH